jgi:predicted Holliday junction resolvase-like endonuclease
MNNKINSFLNSTFLYRFFNSNKIVNPKRDWIILLILFLIMIISVIVFDIIIYEKISSGDMYVSVNREELTPENLKTADLTRLIDNFEAKRQKMLNLKIQPLIDPSI